MFPAKRALALLILCSLVTTFPTGSGDTDDAPERDIAEDQIVVRFFNEIPDDAQDSFAHYGEVIQHVENLRFITLRVDPAEADAIIEEVLERPDVEEAYQPGMVYALHTPNDPLLPAQWGVPPIGIETAWDISMGSHVAKVAILDTGTMYGHPDLTPNTSQGDASCGPDHSVFGGSPADDHFHGTHVAGTVAAVTDNDVGVAGMGQSCIMTVKVLNNWGSGSWAGVAEGIDHATQNGAHIISMSLGGFGAGQIVLDAVNNAQAAGVLVIAAAGNSGCGADTVLEPARFEAVMAVSALRPPGDGLAWFSSCGPAVEISAPGQDVISTNTGGGYRYASGTSMATPHVSGVAGLMKSVNPLLTGEAIRCILNTSADDLGATGQDPQFGNGRLDADEAVLRASLLALDPCFAIGLLPVPVPPLPV